MFGNSLDDASADPAMRSAMRSSLVRCLSLCFLFLSCWFWPVWAAIKESIPDYRLRFRIDHIESPDAPADEAKRKWFLAGGKANLPLKESDWSEWLEISGAFKAHLATKTYPNLYLRTWPFVASFTIHPYNVEKAALTVEWQAGEAQGNYSATYLGTKVSTLLWKDEKGEFRVGPTSEYNERYVSQVEKLNLKRNTCPVGLFSSID